MRELRRAERRIPVHLANDFLEITEWKLPDGVAKRADRCASENFIALMHRFERVAEAAFTEKLGLAEIRIPPGAANAPAHKVIAPRHPIDVVRRRSAEQPYDLVPHRGRAAFVGVETEDPLAAARLDGPVAKVAEARERHLDNTRAKRRRNVTRAVGAFGIDDDDLIGP